MSRHDAAARLRAGVPALAPLAALYGAGVAVSRSRGLKRRVPVRGGARVIAVGNLEVGGSGKTPLAIHLLEIAVAAGRRAAYVSRGYGSAASRGPHVSLVLPAGDAFPDGADGARVIDSAAHPALEGDIGDEATLVALRVPAAIVAVGADKRRAVEVAARVGAEIVVVDDAFQSWSLARDLDVVMLDAERPLGSGRLLPAGSLRERPEALRRADVVVFNGAAGEGEVAAARSRVSRWLGPRAVVLGMRRWIEIEQAGGGGIANGATRALVVSGVARPERVREDIAAQGVVIAGELVFADHHAYTAHDAACMQQAAGDAGATAIVVTGKDWVKLRHFEWRTPVMVARLRVALSGADDVLWLGRAG
jgi:tetraacyldisaccharide 4'-kinase